MKLITKLFHYISSIKQYALSLFKIVKYVCFQQMHQCIIQREKVFKKGRKTYVLHHCLLKRNSNKNIFHGFCQNCHFFTTRTNNFLHHEIISTTFQSFKIVNFLKIGLSPSNNFMFFFNENPLKNDEKCSLFHVKSSFCS